MVGNDSTREVLLTDVVVSEVCSCAFGCGVGPAMHGKELLVITAVTGSCTCVLLWVVAIIGAGNGCIVERIGTCLVEPSK
ncbi:MAG: hypothetical protein ACTJLK_03065 [Anaplasma sp.]